MPVSIIKNREPKTNISAQLPDSIVEKLNAIAIEEDRSISSVIRRIMEDWLAKQ